MTNWTWSTEQSVGQEKVAEELDTRLPWVLSAGSPNQGALDFAWVPSKVDVTARQVTTGSDEFRDASAFTNAL